MEKKTKKPSTYDMLKKLDKKVQQNKTLKKDDSHYRNSHDYKRRRSNSPESHDSRRRRSESPRRQDRRPSKKFLEVIDIDYDVPDRSFGDLYCKACDSHMNSEQMWEAHIQGKRHQKHIKKCDPGELKFEVLQEDPLILPDIKKSTEPIIGLQHCCEIRRFEGKPTYQCFLCSANVPNGQSLIEHVIGIKHRMAYLKEHDPVKHDLIAKTNLKKGMIEPVVAECIRLHQDKHGTGIMQVKLDKSRPSVPVNQNYKKIGRNNFDDDMKKDDRQGGCSEDFRYDRQRDYPRPRFSEDVYDDRYPSENIARDRYYPEPRYPSPPPVNRRSAATYKQDEYERFGQLQHSATNQESYAQCPSQTNDNLRAALEQRRLQERPQSSSSNLSLFPSMLEIIETMPSIMFLELVLHKVESMNPTDSELPMLQKIGNHMISIVMNRKLQKLSPDLLGKYQDNPKPRIDEDQSNKPANNLNNLMDLVSQFNNAKTSSSFNFESQNSSSDRMNVNNPAFMTQTSGSFYNSWGSSSTVEIPGLTLSSTTEEVERPQLTQDSLLSSWPDASYRNRYENF